MPDLLPYPVSADSVHRAAQLEFDRRSWIAPQTILVGTLRYFLVGWLPDAGGALLIVVAHGRTGVLSMADLTALVGAIGGVGLVSAEDGGR